MILRNIGICLTHCKKLCSRSRFANEECPVTELHALADPDPMPGKRCCGKTNRLIRFAFNELNKGKNTIIVTPNDGISREITNRINNIGWQYVTQHSLQHTNKSWLFTSSVHSLYKTVCGHSNMVFFTDEVMPELIYEQVLPLIVGTEGYKWGRGVYSDGSDWRT